MLRRVLLSLTICQVVLFMYIKIFEMRQNEAIKLIFQIVLSSKDLWVTRGSIEQRLLTKRS